MGLFSKKGPCPICGGKISWILPKKIGGEAICNDCAEKIDMQEDIESSLTMEELREYMLFYQQNNLLKEKFIISEKLDFGCFDTKLIFDFENEFFCLSKKPDKTVFEGAQLKSFTIKEDNSMLFEGSEEGLRRYTSTIPDRAMAMAPQITQFMMNQRLSKAVEKLGDDDDDRSHYTRYVDIPEPFREFNVELHLEHPYWNTVKCDMTGPTFSNDYPDLDDYMREYRRDVDVMEQLAKALMDVAFPGSEEILVQGTTGGTVGVQAAAGDAIEDIHKYKALMEEGVISKEEFEAKKKKLLGI